MFKASGKPCCLDLCWYTSVGSQRHSTFAAHQNKSHVKLFSDKGCGGLAQLNDLWSSEPPHHMMKLQGRCQTWLCVFELQFAAGFQCVLAGSVRPDLPFYNDLCDVLELLVLDHCTLINWAGVILTSTLRWQHVKEKTHVHGGTLNIVVTFCDETVPTSVLIRLM